MEKLIYSLCTLTALMCCWFLLRSYSRTRFRLLLWSGLCFAGLAVHNVLLVLDKTVFAEIDLSVWRLATAFVSMLLLVGGLVLEKDQ